MTKFFTNNFSIVNLYSKPSIKSKVVTQMIFGDRFSIIKKKSKWLKVKIKEDNYKGFIINRKFSTFIKPTHKIHILKAKIYKFSNKKKIINQLSFGSKIRVLGRKGKFYKFSNGWIDRINVKPIAYKENDLLKKIIIFKNIKYKWGGKSFKGIDCSALIQVCLNFNNRYCPRDTKDQIKYFKKDKKLKNIKKNDIIFWKGHVAAALSEKKLIHAYGPLKKTVIMGIDQTIKRINKTANLKVKKIKMI